MSFSSWLASNAGARDFMLYVALVLFVLYITRINNMWGVSRGTKKAKEDVRLAKIQRKKELRWAWWLEKFNWISNNIGFEPTEGEIKDFTYNIARLRLRIKSLNRAWKPKELIGLLRGIQLIGAFVGLVGLVLTKNVIFAFFFVLLLVKSAFNTYAEFRIADEDRELEKDFPDLFLLLYSRLQRGAYTRLSPTLDDYLRSLDAMYGGKSHMEIYNFVMDMRNNIEVYGDDSMAVRKMKDIYRSAMVVNFSNLAVQSLNGVDNKDKLLAFKIELAQKKMEQMKLNAEKAVEKGRRSTIIIYVILFEFVVLSWIAKLGGTEMLGNIMK